MSRIVSTDGRWKKTTKGWRYLSNDDDRKMSNRRLNSSLEVAPLNSTHLSPTTPEVWQCVMTYITSPTDLQSLAATCRFLYELMESVLGWSYLIRTKFGSPLWVRHVQQIFHRPINQRIELHLDIETMEKTEVLRECATIPATFLLNRTGDHIMPVTCAMLRSYRYHLETQHSKHIVYIAPIEYRVRQLVSFNNIHNGHLTLAQRRTVPLTKLIYFYLADRRHVPVVDFGMIYPRENGNKIPDSKASTGHALRLSSYGRMTVLHPYRSIMPGRYEVFWRLRFASPPAAGDNLEFIAVPEYGLMAREHTSSKQFANYLNKYGKGYFCRSMGIITVFQRCTVFVGCLDLTSWQSRTNVILDYVEMIAVN